MTIWNRIALAAYAAIRAAEAGKLGSLAYSVTGDWLFAAIAVIVTAFAVGIAMAKPDRLETRVASTWHLIMESLLLPITFQDAIVTAARSPIPGAQGFQNLIVWGAAFVTVQLALSYMGATLIRLGNPPTASTS